MDRHTDAAVPWIDGAIAMLSITAQWLLARRRVESWLLWIIVDLIAVPLFASRGLYATSAVYVVLLGLSIDGLIQWRRAAAPVRSEEHTSELQSLMRNSYALLCLKKK